MSAAIVYRRAIVARGAADWRLRWMRASCRGRAGLRGRLTGSCGQRKPKEECPMQRTMRRKR